MDLSSQQQRIRHPDDDPLFPSKVSPLNVKVKNISHVVNTAVTVKRNKQAVFELPHSKNKKKGWEIPPVVLPKNVLDIHCSRKYYCPASKCGEPIRLAGIDHKALEDFLLVPKNSSSGRSSSLQIQYWGDSLQATMECDMRQWYSDLSKSSYNNNQTNLDPAAVSITYVKIGMSSVGSINLDYLTGRMESANVIVFNIAAHYEYVNISMFEKELEGYEPLLSNFIHLPGNKQLIVRSPSPTHFDTPDGLHRGNHSTTAGTNQTCLPIKSMPWIVQQQDQALRAFAKRLNVPYVDVYSISMGHAFSHPDPEPMKFDCKHFCQNCGVLRAWNALTVSAIMMQANNNGGI